MARGGQDKGVFERPVNSGVWWVRYMWEGKEVRRKIGRKTDAKNYYSRVRAQILEGRYEPEKPRTVTLGEWLREQSFSGRSASQQRGYAKFWTQALGDRALSSIRTNELERLQGALHTEGRLAPSTINRHFAFLKRIFNIALRDKLVKENPVTGVQFFREPKGRTVFLSPGDEARLKEVFPPRCLAVCRVRYSHGAKTVRAVRAPVGERGPLFPCPYCAPLQVRRDPPCSPERYRPGHSPGSESPSGDSIPLGVPLSHRFKQAPGRKRLL